MSLKTTQEVIDFCKSQIEYYISTMIDCNDSSYLNYYQGKVLAHREILANIGYEYKINIKLEKQEI